MPRKTYNALERQREELKWAEEAYLRQHGWKNTCDTPGSYWLFEKALPDGRIVLVSRDLAVSMQSRSVAKW